MKYYIIAGEASGDLHAANLMKALKKTDPARMGTVLYVTAEVVRQIAILLHAIALRHIRHVGHGDSVAPARKPGREARPRIDG